MANLDPYVLPEAIDPAAFHMGGIDGQSLADHLAWAIQKAKQSAGATGEAVLIFLEEKNGEPHYKLLKAPLQQILDEATYPCPKGADDEYQRQVGAPRPVPSALVYPDGRVVVSKPRLCEGCSHNLTRGLRGDCYGLAYDPLPTTR